MGGDIMKKILQKIFGRIFCKKRNGLDEENERRVFEQEQLLLWRTGAMIYSHGQSGVLLAAAKRIMAL